MADQTTLILNSSTKEQTSGQSSPAGSSTEDLEDSVLNFRPHHLRPQDLKHAHSFSSVSSYENSEVDEDEDKADRDNSSSDPSSPSTLHQANAKTFAPSASSPLAKSHTRPQEQRPGGGTLLRPAGKAHDWYAGGRVTSHGRWFRDSQNRTLLMRGVNLCGNSKLPTTPNGSTHLNEGFFDHRNVCFLGRPFPRDQADEHFSRLKRWGLTFVRLLVPWEALEHSGPGIYDEKFIDSLIELIGLMPKYGIKCFIDPHQDCWSRFSGGSGAPGWTFEAAGLDLRKFKTTGAAYVHNTNQDAGDSPPMVWPTNYTKLAASTMFTLFWAGDTFAPNKMYQGESIQQFLQNRYLECYRHLAKRLSRLDAVVGFEVMNEPHPGYVGLKNLNRYDFNSNLFFGDSPSALESFALGDGMALPIEVWVKSWPFPTKKERTRIINAGKESVWLEGECLWRQHGVWSVNEKTGKPRLDRPDYFTKDPNTGEKLDFNRFYLDFVNRYSRAIQSVLPSAFIFVGPIPNEPAPVWTPGDHEDNIVYAPHWYDLHSIFNKSFDGRITHDVQSLSKGKNVFSATYFGLKGAKKNYHGQLANVLRLGLQNVGTKPCLVGECGIPMDINQRAAFMSGDYGYHAKFLDAVLSAMESNLLSFTLWNYNATNDNTYGDHWNGEDFSIFSLDSPQPSPQVATIMNDDSPFDRSYFCFDHESTHDDGPNHIEHIGGRALDAVVRPYAAKVAGEPLSSNFDFNTLQYTFRYCNYTETPVPLVHGTVLMFETEVFIPSFHYDDTGLEILVSDGDWRYVKERQTLYYRHKDMEPGAVHTIRIKPRSMLAGGATSKVIEGSRSSRSVPGNKPESDPNCVSSCSIM
ncbi:glycoside hydrolase superfamily [Linnemannia elongata]|nr:glycoside hydrolase superfamily [Linnemannia elongata]